MIPEKIYSSNDGRFLGRRYILTFKNKKLGDNYVIINGHALNCLFNVENNRWEV